MSNFPFLPFAILGIYLLAHYISVWSDFEHKMPYIALHYIVVTLINAYIVILNLSSVYIDFDKWFDITVFVSLISADIAIILKAMDVSEKE